MSEAIKDFSKEKKSFKKHNLLLSISLLLLFFCCGFVGVGYSAVTGSSHIYGTTMAGGTIVPVNNPTSIAQIQTALNNANPGETVSVTLSQSLQESTLSIPSGVDVILDLAGNSLSGPSNNGSSVPILSLTGDCDVTIKNTGTGGSVYSQSKGAAISLTNFSGNLTIEDCTISTNSKFNSPFIASGNGGNVTIRNCTLETSRGKDSIVLSGNLTMLLDNCIVTNTTSDAISINSGNVQLTIDGENGRYENTTSTHAITLASTAYNSGSRITVYAGTFDTNIFQDTNGVILAEGSTLSQNGQHFVVTKN